ncbi:hypothetical protein AB0C29_13500 [Actinoplanes sp. NPDC048791]|uniref:hypothetical protein n=1 Tax=Actinoplanes sp. NPDC048791 TaxID=3154623 RepID=UPI0033D7E9C7
MILLGAAPNLVVLGYWWWPHTVWFTWTEGSEAAGIPYARFSRAELVIIPATLLVALGAALVPRTRPLALWLLIGGLSGATCVLFALALSALTWT